jgi:2-oxoglutarate ferredoxin oxidoreductase subunit alpha
MKGPIMEAMNVANENGRKVNFLQIKMALPFPSELVTKVLASAKKTLLVENNSTAQMAGVIREYTGIALLNQFLRYDGRPIHSSQILDRINLDLA